MSKTKQIIEILFPNGWWNTYFPACLCLAVSVLAMTMYFHGGLNKPWILLLNCISLTLSLRMLYKTYKRRQRIDAEEQFMQAVFLAVRPELERLHEDALNSPDGFNPRVFFELMEQSKEVIDAEIARRKNLAILSSSDKP